MDKKKIEEFATSSRKQLIENLTYEANRIGITKEKIHNPTDTAEDMQTYTTAGVTNTIYAKQIEQREQLVQEIINNGFEQTIEKIAYTWFNRIIAIRYMEINNYLPTHTRVLSSITPGQKEPDIITEALNLKEHFQYTTDEEEKIYQYKEENQTDELFKLLFIKQCNKLNEILPELFETIDDYTEILFNIQLSNPNNIINKLVTNIPEENFQDQVEIIGWIYQYYNKELKDETYKNIKKVKVGKDRIPAVTQLFTPDWIVKYMVENSLGRLWLENHENKELKDSWKYYLEEAEQKQEVQEKLEKIKSTYKDTKPEEIKILDPSMGSGHILVYVFDVLMQIYTSQGYTKKEAVKNILENNIYGIDIDDRAYQLAYFAIMMKARSYHRRILNTNIKPNLVSIQETNSVTNELITIIKSTFPESSNELIELIETFKNGKTLGTITKTNKNMNTNIIENIIKKLIKNSTTYISLIKHVTELKLLKNILSQTKILNNKFDIVITNPPYMGNKNMNKILSSYVKKNYPDSKMDLFAVFIERIDALTKKNGLNALIVQQTFMYLNSYEKFRETFLYTKNIINMLHLGSNAFDDLNGEVVQVCAFISKLTYLENFIGKYIKLIDYDDKKNNLFIEENNYEIKQDNFLKIPYKNMVYDLNNEIINLFEYKKLGDSLEPKAGIVTGKDPLFLKKWYEVDYNNINFMCKNYDDLKKSTLKWYPITSGGASSKWYGDFELVIDLKNEGHNIKTRPNNNFRLRDGKYYFKEGITWNGLSTNKLNVRYVPEGILFGNNSPTCFIENNLYYYLGFLNSSVANYIISMLNPTLSIVIKNIISLPLIEKTSEEVNLCVKENINKSKFLWNSQELSFNFTENYMICSEKNLLKDALNDYKIKLNEINQILLKNQTLIDTFFIELYGLTSLNIKTKSDEKIISKKKIITDLLSYIVGCIFGRYSVDEKGLIFAGGEFDINKYKSVKPDEDNIIPVLDEKYFDDDIVNQIVNFIKVAFGEDTLDENLKCIAEILDVSGKSSREIIRNYMIKKFYSNHVSMYQKCPIYWMFDSGKENAFKCLVYMHRYEPDLVSRIRHDYLQKTQRAIDENIKQQDNIIKNSENKAHVNRANKEKTKLVKQLDEIKLYDLALAHVANEQIELDLDDGVKVNYAKFQNVEVVDPKTNKTKKINLLKKL